MDVLHVHDRMTRFSEHELQFYSFQLATTSMTRYLTARACSHGSVPTAANEDWAKDLLTGGLAPSNIAEIDAPRCALQVTLYSYHGLVLALTAADSPATSMGSEE